MRMNEKQVVLYSTSGWLWSNGTQENVGPGEPEQSLRLESEVIHRADVVSVEILTEGDAPDVMHIRVVARSQERADQFWQHIAATLGKIDLWAL